MSTHEDREKAEILAYAEDIRNHGYSDVEVYRYRTSLDNITETRIDHREGYGYTVTYTGSPPGWQHDTPHHDRSFTVFCGKAGIPHKRLINGGILADIPGRDVTPYWVAAWSTEDSLSISGRTVHEVIMKRFKAHDDDGRYSWQMGPRETFHLIMDKVT